MDFGRVIFNFNVSETAAVKGMSCNKESLLENMANDFLNDDFSEFSNKDIAGAIGSSECRFLNSKSDSTSMTYLGGTVNDDASILRGTSDTIGVIEQCVHDNRDAYYFPYTDTSGLDWFSTFNSDPFTLGGFSIGEDSLLFCNENNAVYESAVHQNGMANNERDEKISSSNSNTASTVEALCADLEAIHKRSFEASVPGRARSKRSRTGVRVWSSGILSNNSDSASEPSDVTVSFQPFSSSEPELKGLAADEEGYNSFDSSFNLGKWNEGLENGQTRRCTHCLTQRTPQWRIGPAGPKTLCNACGVRYNSGRLFPEYRPVKSPTFIHNQHSNSHKRVVEMRIEKAMATKK